MLYTQIGAWLFGAFLVAYFLMFDTATFDKTALLQLFHTILVTPWPLWLILILSGFGTYVNILFDDDVFDVAKAKNKKTLFDTNREQLYTTIVIFTATFMLYVLLLHATHTHIKLL